MRGPGNDADLERRVEEVSARLRSMGYLRNPLETFVAGRGARTASLRALGGVALRFGIVGGFLVSLLVWLGTIALNPGLAASDLFLLALHLFAIYALSVTAIAAIVGGGLLVVVRAAGPRASLGALLTPIGALATIVTFLYGTFWWRWFLFAPGVGLFASRLHLFAGLLIILLSLLIGRLARLSAALLVEAGRATCGAPAIRRARETARVAVIGLLSAMLFFVYMTVTRSGDVARAQEASPFGAARAKESLLIVGIDGLSWQAFEYLAGQGDLPNLAAIVAGSARAPLVVPGGSPPPEIWTTIATGETPLRHGVRAFVLPRLAGMRAPISIGRRPPVFLTALETVIPSIGLAKEVPVSGLTRRSKALWEVVGEKGRSVAAVNWWATWPAAGAPGRVVSERAFARVSGTRRGSVDLTEDVAPAALAPFVRAIAESVLAGVGDSGEGLAASEKEAVRLARGGDLFALAIAEPLLAEIGEGGVLAVYLPGLDVLGQPLDEERPRGAGLASIDARLAAIRDHARDIDAAIARLASLHGSANGLAIIATPGRSEADGEPPVGLFALAGPGTRAPQILGGVRPEEVAPSLLVYLGFPASRALGAPARTDFLSDDLIAERPPAIVASFGERSLPVVSDATRDEEFLERLRSLGYIQ